MTNDETNDRILREPEVLQKAGIARTTLIRWEKAGKFPARVRIGERAVGWRLSEIQAWMANRPTAA